MTRVKHPLYAAFILADENYGEEIVKAYGAKNAGDARYYYRSEHAKRGFMFVCEAHDRRSDYMRVWEAAGRPMVKED